MLEWLRERIATWQFLGERSNDDDLVVLLSLVCFIAGVLLVSIVANFLARRIILRFLKFLVEKSSNTYDDVLLESQVFSRLSHLAQRW